MLRAYLTVLGMDFTMMAAYTAMVLLAERTFRAGSLAVGALVSIGSLIYVVASVFFGRLCERVDRRLILVGATLCGTVSYVGFFLAGHLYQLYVCASLNALAGGAFWPAIEVRLTHGVTGLTRQRRIRNFNLCWCSSAAFASFAAGALSDLGERIPFLVAAAVGLVCVGLVSQRDAEVHGEVHAAEPPGPEPPDPLLWASWIGSFAFNAAAAIVLGLLPKLALNIQCTGTEVGIMFFAMRIAQFAVFLTLGVTSLWHDRFRWLFAVEFVGVAGGLLIAFGLSKIAFVGGAALVGIGFGGAYYASLFHSVKGGRIGRKAGIHEAIVGGGSFFGPAVGGAIAEVSGCLIDPFLFLSTFGLLVMSSQTALILAAKRSRRT